MSNFKFEIRNLKSEIMDVLFPHHCIGCNVLGTPFCDTCIASVPLRDLGCLACGARNQTGVFCANCKRHANFLTRTVWAASYETKIINAAITQLKYQGNRALADALGVCIVTLLQKRVQEHAVHIPANAALLSIPLHPRRRRERGFNQSELIAAAIAQKFPLPLLPQNVLARTRYTQAQAKVRGREARLKNMKGAFQVPQNAISLVKEKTVLLVDDIATTGSTLNEAARALKEAGASQVWGIVAAKG